MAYRQDLSDAARRHFRAAEELHGAASAGSQPRCRAVAGYLFGLAGELCVKEMMRQSGVRPPEDARDRGHPYYAHFPDLKDRLKDHLQGRRMEQLRRIAESSALFESWSIKMRYAPTGDIPDARVARWRESARDLIEQMENA